MVRDKHLAEDVTQGVFVALAKNAGQLSGRPVLAGWLHRTAQNIAAQTVRTEVRRRNREQEAAAMNQLLANEAAMPWEKIAPHLDAALGELNESERDSLLLRYFEKKSAREMAQILHISEEAAQKRVSRAVDQLRDYFSKRGAAIAAGTLVTVIAAHAVQAAPVALGAAIVTSTLANTSAVTTTLAATTKADTMTTFQKVTVAGAIAAALGFAIVEAKKYSSAKSELEALQQTQRELAQSMEAVQTKAAQQVADLKDENTRLNQNASELLKLRGEVTRLRNNPPKVATGTFPGAIPNDSSAVVPASGRVTFAGTNQTTVKWGNTVITGGWKLVNGDSVFLMITPTQILDPNQLSCKLKIIETSAIGGDSGGKLLGVLEPNQVDVMLKKINEQGSATIREMQISTTSGTQAAIKTGSSEDDAGSIELLPVISQDGETVDMKITSVLNYPK